MAKLTPVSIVKEDDGTLTLTLTDGSVSSRFHCVTLIKTHNIRSFADLIASLEPLDAPLLLTNSISLPLGSNLPLEVISLLTTSRTLPSRISMHLVM